MAMATPLRRADGTDLRVILQFLNNEEDKNQEMAATKVLKILGYKIRLDKYSTNPHDTWEYIEDNIPDGPEPLNADGPMDSGTILVYGPSGSGKTTTLCGHPDFNLRGIIHKLAGNLDVANIRVMEFTRHGVRDLVAVHRRKKAGVNTYTKLKDLNTWNDLRETRAEHLDGILRNRKIARTANNDSSSRSFVCIYLTKDNGQKWTIVDMPGTENKKNIEQIPNMSYLEKRDMSKDALFINKTLFEFSVGVAKKTPRYKNGGLWQFVLAGTRKMFLIACAKADHENKRIESVASFLHRIPHRGNKNPEKGTSRSPLYDSNTLSAKASSGALSPAVSNCSSLNATEAILTEYVHNTEVEYERVIRTYQQENHDLLEENRLLKQENETLIRRLAERDENREELPGPSSETRREDFDGDLVVRAKLPVVDVNFEDDDSSISVSAGKIRETNLDYLKEKYHVDVNNEDVYRGIQWNDWLQHVRENVWRCRDCRKEKQKAVAEGDEEEASEITTDRNPQHSVAHVFGKHMCGKYICKTCNTGCTTPNHARKHCLKK